MNKTCTKCGLTKPLTEFYKDKNSNDGHRYECKPCYKKRTQKYRAENKEKCRNMDYIKHYGITLEQYNKLYEDQLGVCAICGKPETRVIKGNVTRLCVDHDHRTNKIRHLLCNMCNRALGLFQDDIELLKKAVQYLSNS